MCGIFLVLTHNIHKQTTRYEQSNSFKNDTSLCALHRKKSSLRLTQTSHCESQLSGKMQADEKKCWRDRRIYWSVYWRRKTLGESETRWCGVCVWKKGSRADWPRALGTSAGSSANCLPAGNRWILRHHFSLLHPNTLSRQAREWTNRSHYLFN